jgi:hypothetical protein
MTSKEYRSGTFCREIECAHHKALEDLQGDEYTRKKMEFCRDCYAWRFYTWLRENKWRIVQAVPDMSSKELAARIKGVDPTRVDSLTIEEILCL